MLFEYRYSGSTVVESTASSVGMSFAPDTFRPPTYFVGSLNKRVPFREAISALHDVVISDLRFKPKDKTEYLRWAKEQEETQLAEALAGAEGVAQRVQVLRGELAELNQQRQTAMAPFYKAQERYFKYLFLRDMAAWYVLDPVITVHPDELFFECFSEDEATYGRLGCNYEVFSQLNDFSCGTTNIDYSDGLYKEFQKIRDYKDTQFQVDPSGFEVQTQGEEEYKEVKIDLPDSWVRGFLQVSSAMTLPGYTFDLHPLDLHNFCFVLRRMKEKKGPRSMRFRLKPGEPVSVIFEPWNLEVKCPRSVYTGPNEDEIRIWGRRRLLILERLLPVAKRFQVTLLGSGMPSFFLADLGDMNFTLGLSGWTANDWSRAGNFDLMAPRANVDNTVKARVFEALQETWVESSSSLANRLALGEDQVLGALSAYTQAGRVIYDLNSKVYRIRELSREPLPMDQLRFANEREELATRLVEGIRVQTSREPDNILKLTGRVQDGTRRYEPEIFIDGDQRMIRGTCTCNFYTQNKLYQGPCEHMLALRMASQQNR